MSCTRTYFGIKLRNFLEKCHLEYCESERSIIFNWFLNMLLWTNEFKWASWELEHRANFCERCNKFYCLLTALLGISLDKDQSDAHFLYFTIRPLQSSTCFDHYMLIIRSLNCIDVASSIALSVSGCPVHRLRENTVLSQPVHRTATEW